MAIQNKHHVMVGRLVNLGNLESCDVWQLVSRGNEPEVEKRKGARKFDNIPAGL